MDKRLLKKTLIIALASGDIEAIKKIKRQLNPVKVEIDRFYAVFKDGKPTGEAYEIDGTPLEIDLSEEPSYSDLDDDELPTISTIVIAVPNKAAMLENIAILKTY